MARALDTLDITHEPIRQIFYSMIPGTPYKRPLDRLQPRTETKYIQIWRHFLYWTFRAAPFWADTKRSSSTASRGRWNDFSASRTRSISRRKYRPVIATASSEPPVVFRIFLVVRSKSCNSPRHYNIYSCGLGEKEVRLSEWQASWLLFGFYH